MAILSMIVECFDHPARRTVLCGVGLAAVTPT
jgi:hypothetical protein